MTITQDQFYAIILAGDVGSSFIKNAVGGSGPAGSISSGWKCDGDPPIGTTPTSAAVCTGATTGARVFVAPTSGNTYVCLWEMTGSTSLTQPVILADRIVHMGGLDGTNTGVQTVSTPTLPSDRGILADYSDLSWYLEWYTATGVTPQTATITYTNQAGTGSRTTTVAVTASVGIGKMLLISPAAGDFIKSIESVQLGGSTGTAGNFGVTCKKDLCYAPMGDYTNKPYLSDWASLGLPRVYDNSCLFFVVRTDGSGTGVFGGRLILGQW